MGSDDGNSTQQLSDSQVVDVSASSSPKPVAKNDQSAWKGMVLGANEFAPPPAKRSRATWVIAGVLGIAAIGGGLYATGVVGGGGRASQPITSQSQPPAAPTPIATTTPPAPVSAPTGVPPSSAMDAAVAVIAADAAVAAPPAAVDAISAAGPPAPRATKPTAVKKKPSAKKRGH